MQQPLPHLIRSNRVLLGVICLSLAVSFLRVPLLNGTFAALVIAVISQLYLPGYVLARVLGKTRIAHPISRFAWILTCGLGLTVTLGAAGRLFNIPIPAYLIALHAIMLVLVLLPAPALSGAPPWRITRQTLPLYIAVAVSCLTVLGVSYESRFRFYGFEDQPIFISLVDWLVEHPDLRPNDVPLRSRQIGVLNGDSRFDSDGWSYNQAAWSWVSGVPARQIIWYDLGTLFVWAVPLLTFALAYELTNKESTAAASAAAITIAGLLTLDNIVYNPTYSAFGRFAVFQISVLRQMSITIMLPLALLAGLAYLKSLRRNDLAAAVLAGLALAFMHPIQATIFVMGIGATALLSWLAQPSRARLLRLLPLALLLLVILSVPLVQRLNRSGLNAADTVIQDVAESESETAANDAFLIVRDLPLVGTTYIRNPADVFYSPVIVLAVLLALLSGWWWRHSLAAQFLSGSTVVALLIFFVPGLTELFNKIASSVGLLTTMFLIPVPLALTIPPQFLRDSFTSNSKNEAAKTPRLTAGLARWAGLVLFGLALIWLVYEPIPLRASARDQLRAYNAVQSLRHLHPAQMLLADSLRAHLPADSITIVATPYDVANVVIEEVPDTLITSGRRNRNLAITANNRFMNEGGAADPWLDGDDLAFLEKWGVTHVIVTADMTRLPQMELQPERFERLDAPAGYVLFKVEPAIENDAIDALYGDMNRLYNTMERPRWDRHGFNLILPGDADAWETVAAAWQQILVDEPENDRALLGLAFTYTMMGADADALPLWQDLNARYPDVAVYADGLASTLQAVDPAGDSAIPLINMLDSPYDAARVLAVRRLLTENFVYRLDDERMQKVVAVTENDAVTWDRLANMGQQEPIRQRAALFMDAGQWTAAAASLDALPVPERAPEDLIARAAIQLVQGDTQGALDMLRPAADPDQIAANVFLHADRWENNMAAQAYFSLLEGDSQSLLTIAETQSLYVMQPEISRADEDSLTVTATYGNPRPRNAYPIQTWRHQVVSPDSATKYAEVDVPAQFVDGALVRVSTDINLPDDIPQLTEALVIIEPRYNDAVTATPAILPVVLNRPESVTIPAEATRTDWRFSNGAGDTIALQGYTLEQTDNQLDLNLYWQTDAVLSENYQVFVHVIDGNGQQVGGGDSAPVNNRYPTGQWQTGVTILDPRTILFDSPLPPGDYSLRIGLYRLPGGERLTVSPVDERVQDNSVLIGLTINE